MNWPLVQIRHVARFKYGSSLPIDERSEGNVSVYGSNGPVGSHDTHNTESPVIVIGRKGSQGKLRYSSDPVFAIDTTYYVDPSCTASDIRWSFYALNAIDLDSLGQDVGVPGLNRDQAYSQRIPLPSSKVQRAIADYLDAEIARIDTLISKARGLIELLDERRAANVGMAVVAGHGNREDLAETSNHYVPRLPRDWRLMRLRHVVEQIIDTPHKTAPVVDDKEYLVVRTANVKTGRLVFVDARYTDRASWIEWNRRGEPRPGDVMFTREAPAGEACVVPAGVPLCIGQRMVLFRVNPAVACGEWIVHSIYSGPAQRFIEELSNATTVAHLNMSDIHDIPIAVPDKDEQQRILAQVRTEVRRHEEAVSKLNEQITLLAERRKALITAVVTGEMPVPGVSA